MTGSALGAGEAGGDGYRHDAAGGPRVRTDIIDVYVARRSGRATAGAVIELLQLRRADEPLRGTWQPVMGHIERGETAVVTALRELEEETGLTRGDGAWLGMWALEQVHPYFVAAIDAIVLSPRFVVEVAPGWEPRLDADHDAHRWVDTARAREFFLWPGQHAAVAEVVTVLNDESLRKWLRVVVQD